MTAILTRAGCFVAIILLGYLLKRVGFYKKEDFHVLSRTVINITLSAAIINSYAGKALDPSMLLLTLIGFLFDLMAMGLAYVTHFSAGRERLSFAILNNTGCNIGNFVLPFAQGFLGPVGVMAACMFDAGNSMYSLGGAFGVASAVKHAGTRFSMKPVIRALSRSVPFLTYFTMIILSSLRVPIPTPVTDLTAICGNANAFLAMLMIGVGFELSFDRTQLGAIARILIPRFAMGILLAVLSYRFLPLAEVYRQALVILFLSPVPSSAPAFTAKMGSDYGLACAVNSVSILTSIVLIVSALTIML